MDSTGYNQEAYICKFADFSYKYLFINQYELPLNLLIRRLLSAIFPEISYFYLSFSLWIKKIVFPPPQISITAASFLCENWTSEYENLIGNRE